MTIDDQTRTALERAGISWAEHHVMSTVDQEPERGRDGIPAIAAALSQGDQRGTLSERACAEALNECFRRGLIALATDDLLPAPGALSLVHDTIVGKPVLTASGAAMHQDVLRSIFGQAFLDDYNTGWVLRDQAVEILAPTLDCCQRRCAAIASNIQEYSPIASHVQSVGAIDAIGEWIPHPNVLLKSGFRCVIEFATSAGAP